MTPEAALSELLQRLDACRGAEVLIGDAELREWTPEVLGALQAARLVVRARPASHLVCPGCEQQCAKGVEVFPAEGARPARAYIICDEPEDLGRIEIPLPDLEQWRTTGAIFADAISQLLKIPTPPTMDGDARRWLLGPMPRVESKGAIALSIEHGGTLTLADVSVPLAQVVTFGSGGWRVDTSGLLGTTADDSQKWRTEAAKAAAEALHNRPGGSREMKERIRALWASGKYTSRDRCAEEECAALGISFVAARKALRNTPEPDRT